MDLWDPATGEHLRALPGIVDRYGGIALSPDGKTLATVYGGNVHLWDLATGQRLRTVNLHPGLGPGVNDVIFSPDGKSLVTVPGYSGWFWIG